MSYFPELRWDIDLIENPTIIRIENDTEDLSKIKTTKLQHPYKNPIYIRTDITDLVCINLGMDESAILKIDDLRCRGVQVNYGKDVISYGGYIEASGGSTQKIRSVLRFSGQSGTIYVEGMHLNANNKEGLDALLAGGVAHMPERRSNLVVQRCLLDGLRSFSDSTYHSDGFQTYGPLGVVRMDHVSIRTSYQGLFLDPQHDIIGYDLSNIDITYNDPQEGHGYAFYLRQSKQERRPTVRLNNIWVQERSNFPGKHIYPDNGVECYIRKDGFIKFPNNPEVIGGIKNGIRPEGPFVVSEYVGKDYRG